MGSIHIDAGLYRRFVGMVDLQRLLLCADDSGPAGCNVCSDQYLEVKTSFAELRVHLLLNKFIAYF